VGSAGEVRVVMARKVIDCENCIYRVQGVEVRIIRWDEQANPSVINSDIFNEYCTLRFHPIGSSGYTMGCSEGKEKTGE